MAKKYINRDPRSLAVKYRLGIIVGALLLYAAGLGLLLPPAWQIPCTIVVLTFGAIAGVMRTRRREEANALGVRQLSILMNDATEAISRIEARAHKDEIRMREVGQLAKKAALNSESLIHRGPYAEEEEGGLARKRLLRPPSSTVTAAEGPKPVGRLAAAVKADPARSVKLLQALNYRDQSTKDALGSVAMIATQNLSAHIERSGFEPELLLPSSSASQIAKSRADILLVEEHAFHEGAWFGADSPAGTALYEELISTCAAAKRVGMRVFFVQSKLRPNVYTAKIRDAADYSFPSLEFSDPWAEGADFGLMQTIQEYAVQDRTKR